MNHAKFHATGGGLFWLYLKNIFLTVITLGVYRFWAKTNIQKYFMENIEYEGERFSFHGTGKERFIGFLKAILIFAGAIVVYLILNFILGKILGSVGEYAVLFLFTVAFLGIIPFVVVGNRRYLTSRSGYRNIRFGFQGKSLDLAKIYLKGIPLSVITLGLYLPFFIMEVESFLRNNLRYGNVRFGFNGDGKEYFMICMKGFFLTIITFGIYGSWFYVNRQRYLWSKTSFQGKDFSFTLTGWDLFKNILIAYLLIIITLGIGFAWVVARMVRIFLNNLALSGNVDFAGIQSEPDPSANATTEGLEALADTLDSFLS
jgi:uncharacterized membrane protein YjgN (DUF898 family)